MVLLMTVMMFVFLQPAYQKNLGWHDQAYARHNLTRLFEAERQFFIKYGSYTSNLIALGWKPSGPLKYHYGFPNALVPAEAPPGYSGNYAFSMMNTESPEFLKMFLQVSESGKALPSLRENIFGHGVVEREGKGVGYVAVAVGNLDADEALDRFAVFEDGTIVHLCNDLEVEWESDPACEKVIYPRFHP
jgi:hypothetical protein